MGHPARTGFDYLLLPPPCSPALTTAAAAAGSPLTLFPKSANKRNSFCYVAVDPNKRLVRWMYHAHLPFW